MYLDDGDAGGGDGITKRNRCVRETAWIHYDPDHSFRRGFLEPIDQFSFMVALIELKLQIRKFRMQSLLNVRKRHVAVDIGLSSAQKVQVRTVEDEELHVMAPVIRRMVSGEYTHYLRGGFQGEPGRRNVYSRTVNASPS